MWGARGGDAGRGARQWSASGALAGPERAGRMGIADGQVFRTKGQLAIDICTDAYADGVVFDFACGDEVYGCGWRKGAWAGASEEFHAPALCYFRTMESWMMLLTENGFDILETREPLRPNTGQPASVIFIPSPRGR